MYSAGSRIEYWIIKKQHLHTCQTTRNISAVVDKLKSCVVLITHTMIPCIQIAFFQQSNNSNAHAAAMTCSNFSQATIWQLIFYIMEKRFPHIVVIQRLRFYKLEIVHVEDVASKFEHFLNSTN